MRVSNEAAQQSRQRIVEVSARLFRERGVDGVGVVELMKAAGFTQGGFYKHFESKEALAAEACTLAFEDLQQRRWSRLLVDDNDGKTPLQRFIEAYLSTRHRDNPGDGCPMPSLGADCARHDPAMRGAFTEGLTSLVDLLAASVPGRTAKARRERALATVACLAGAISLARAVDDESLSEEILQSAIASLE
ncbi:MAG TPA: TetR/AcrR family transcriptional regulator [Lysobacter sp.]